MARQSKKRRKQEEAEREELLAPDAFEAGGGTVTPWLERNFRLVAAGVVLVLVGIAAAEVFRQSGDAAAGESTAALVEGTEAYADAVGVQAVLSATTAAAREEALSKARLALAPALDGAGGAATLARLYDADLARRLGENEAALAGYEAYLSATEGRGYDPLQYFALEGRGLALEALGRLDEALDTFRGIEATERFDDLGSMHVARILTAKGDREGAKAAYQRVIAREPASPMASTAEQKLAALD